MAPEERGANNGGSIPMAVGDGAGSDRGGPDAAGTAMADSHPTGRRGWVVALVVVVVATGAWFLRPPREAGPTPVLAPVEAPALRWSLDVSGGDEVEVVVVPDPDGDDLLVRRADPAGGPGRHLLQRLDGRTGRRAWSVPVAPGEVVVPVLEGRPLGGPDYPLPPGVDVATGVRVVDVADGATAWTRTGAVGTTVASLTDASLVVVDRRSCGAVDASSGRDRFRLGTADTSCDPLSDVLRWEDRSDWAFVDGGGQAVARVAIAAGERVDVERRPRLVGDVVVRLGEEVAATAPGATRRVVRATSSDDDPLWEVELDDGPWWRLEVLGDDHLMVVGARGTEVLDAATGRTTARFATGVIAVPAADGMTRVLGPRDGPDDLAASGVWSRSPDAATVVLSGTNGEVLGTQAVVVTSTPVATTAGVLLAHGPDDDRRVSLFAADDLAVVWDLPTELRFAQVLASSGDLVVVVGDLAGGRRLEVLGP